MKKSALKRKITELSKALNSKQAQEACEILIGELKHYKEPSFEDHNTKLPTPKEIEGKIDVVALFTDGGCRGNPGPGAYAFIVQNCDGDIILEGAEASQHTTNNKMEMLGVIKGLEALTKFQQKYQKTIVYTDSKYVVNGMNSWVAGWKSRGWKKADKKAPENLDLWQRLDNLNTQQKIEYIWVKGHSGHPQNERVDHMANVLMDEHGY